MLAFPAVASSKTYKFTSTSAQPVPSRSFTHSAVAARTSTWPSAASCEDARRPSCTRHHNHRDFELQRK